MLSPSTLATLLHVADVAVPLEMCGLLFSEQRFQACRNVSVDPWHEFEIAHEEFLQHMADYGEAPWAIVHSHPRTSAHLSPKDCRLLDAMQLTKVDMVMVIVSVPSDEVKAYTKDADQYRLRATYPHVRDASGSDRGFVDRVRFISG